MGKIYEIDIEYIENEKILLLDSLTKKLVKADVSKSCSVKYMTTTYSRTVDKLKKADKNVCFLLFMLLFIVHNFFYCT